METHRWTVKPSGELNLSNHLTTRGDILHYTSATDLDIFGHHALQPLYCFGQWTPCNTRVCSEITGWPDIHSVGVPGQQRSKCPQIRNQLLTVWSRGGHCYMCRVPCPRMGGRRPHPRVASSNTCSPCMCLNTSSDASQTHTETQNTCTKTCRLHFKFQPF